MLEIIYLNINQINCNIGKVCKLLKAYLFYDLGFRLRSQLTTKQIQLNEELFTNGPVILFIRESQRSIF